MGERRPLSAKLTDEAHRGWGDFAYANRVSIVALLEAIGQRLDRERQLWDDPLVQGTVEVARQITDERRVRRRA